MVDEIRKANDQDLSLQEALGKVRIRNGHLLTGQIHSSEPICRVCKQTILLVAVFEKMHTKLMSFEQLLRETWELVSRICGMRSKMLSPMKFLPKVNRAKLFFGS